MCSSEAANAGVSQCLCSLEAAVAWCYHPQLPIFLAAAYAAAFYVLCSFRFSDKERFFKYPAVFI